MSRFFKSPLLRIGVGAVIIYSALATIVICQFGVTQEAGWFGDLFGSISSLLTALNLGFLIFAIVLQTRETRRLNEISKWQANYNYLLDAKKLIVEHPEVLELHGLSKDLPKTLGVTNAQVAYVVLDLKAADLYYRIDGSDPVIMTAYRKNMLRVETYRKIAKECVVAGTLLPDSPFCKALRKELEGGMVIGT